jgi:hypothetical protein
MEKNPVIGLPHVYGIQFTMLCILRNVHFVTMADSGSDF